MLKQAADSFSGISCPMVVVGAENGIRPLTGNLYRAKAARNARSLTRHGSSKRITLIQTNLQREKYVLPGQTSCEFIMIEFEMITNATDR